MMVDVIVKKVGEDEKVVRIDSSLESLQSIIEGYIEFVYPRKMVEKGLYLIVNDEGKLEGLGENLLMVDENMSVVDILVGNVIVCGLKESNDGRDVCSLSPEKIKEYMKMRYVGITADGEEYQLLKCF